MRLIVVLKPSEIVYTTSSYEAAMSQYSETIEDEYVNLVDDLHDNQDWFSFHTKDGGRKTIRTDSVCEVRLEKED